MYLLDTNCLSEMRKITVGRAHPNVAAWAALVPSSRMFISVLTIFEVQIGISRARKRDPIKANRLTDWLEQQVLTIFEGRILAVDAAIARTAGRFAGGNAIDTADVLIAATAFVRGLTLVTRNTSDFRSLDILVLDPWHAF